LQEELVAIDLSALSKDIREPLALLAARRVVEAGAEGKSRLLIIADETALVRAPTAFDWLSATFELAGGRNVALTLTSQDLRFFVTKGGKSLLDYFHSALLLMQYRPADGSVVQKFFPSLSATEIVMLSHVSFGDGLLVRDDGHGRVLLRGAATAEEGKLLASK
jgi:hypothetical protein